jgi:DNA gyrase subunit A
MDTRPDGLVIEAGLIKGKYRLSDVQAQAILDLRLHRLTGLEQDKIINEYKDILDKIKQFSSILADPDLLLKVIQSELLEIRDAYGDERRTEIVQDHSDLNLEDLIPEEEVVVTLSHGGYAKAQPIEDYQAQKRGGRGRSATKVKDEDFVDKLFIANTHDTILCFSSRGKMYWLKVFQVPQASRGSRGKPIINLLPLEDDERINAVLPIREYAEGHYVFMATSGGTVKKTPLSQFSRPRSSGIIAIDLRGDDKLVSVELTDGNAEVLLVASHGKSIRFKEEDVRPMGRAAAGVRGIKLPKGEEVIALSIMHEGLILTATENGYGKRTSVDDFPVQGRGGQGVIAIQTTERNGKTVGALQVADDDEVMLISSNGTLVRTGVDDISIMGRNTQGVRLIRVEEGQRLVGLAKIEAVDEDEE